MAPVQTILTGPGSLLGSYLHTAPKRIISQSQCRTITSHGLTQSNCVGCQSFCFDIDSEKSYFFGLRQKRGLSWAWYSYPGLVLGFFLLIEIQSIHGVDYLRSGIWAFDSDVIDLIWKPLYFFKLNSYLPRLFVFPILLFLFASISVILFRLMESSYELHLSRSIRFSRKLARHRVRLISTAVAVNIFFFFADPSLGSAPIWIWTIIRLIIFIVSTLWINRNWRTKAPDFLFD
jgi:hypothetical protein